LIFEQDRPALDGPLSNDELNVSTRVMSTPLGLLRQFEGASDV